MVCFDFFETFPSPFIDKIRLSFLFPYGAALAAAAAAAILTPKEDDEEEAEEV